MDHGYKISNFFPRFFFGVSSRATADRRLGIWSRALTGHFLLSFGHIDHSLFFFFSPFIWEAKTDCFGVYNHRFLRTPLSISFAPHCTGKSRKPVPFSRIVLKAFLVSRSVVPFDSGHRNLTRFSLSKILEVSPESPAGDLSRPSPL